MPALPAVRPARPPTAIKPRLTAFSDGQPGKSFFTLVVSCCNRLFRLKGRIVIVSSTLGARRLGDRVDQLVFRHVRPPLDADAGRELDQLRLPVGLQAA